MSALKLYTEILFNFDELWTDTPHKFLLKLHKKYFKNKFIYI